MKKFEFANSLRGFAALSVLISHYFGVFWIARSAIPAFTYAPVITEQMRATPWYIMLLHPTSFFDWGPFGVALFFLISGFVIPFSLQTTDWKGFMVNRFFRIFPTYAVGLTITILAVWSCTLYFHQPFPFHVYEIFLHYLPGIHDIFHTKNIDGVIWTLEIEIKFYVLCAAAIYLFQKNSWKVFLLPVFLGISTLCLKHPLEKYASIGGIKFDLVATYVFCTPYLTFMFIGTLFNYYQRRLLTAEQVFFTMALLFLLFMLTTADSAYNAQLKNTWSYGFALLLFSFAYARQPLFRGNKVVNFLADISYPLYVVHGIAGYVVLTILLNQGYRSSVALVIAVMTATITATLLHKFIEKPTQLLGKRLMKKVQDSSEPWLIEGKLIHDN